MIKIVILSLLIVGSFASLSFLGTNTCSAKGEKCGHELEGQRSCCQGLKCNFGAAIGAPGVCQEKCAVEDEPCGHEFEGNTACCSGFSCTIAHPGRLGARGVCKPSTVLTTVEAPQQCVSEGSVCGHELAGNNHCCDGLTCATFGGALGGNGVCMKQTEVVSLVEAPQQCVVEGGVCGHELAGNNHCCEGLSCATFGGALGGNGVCMKNQVTEELYRCGSKGQSCGLGFEGGLICCEGHECVFPEESLPGSKGVCLEKKTEKPVCAAEGDICSHEFEGARCCSGFSCATVADAPRGAPGVCLRDAVIALIRKTEKNVCAAEGEICGHEREGQKNCCEGFVCYLGDVPPLGSTGVCMRQISL